MDYRDFDGWQPPPRAPQHAAPFGFWNRFRHQVRRALRLLVTGGIWAAAVCLVISSIVLVANTAHSGGTGRPTVLRDQVPESALSSPTNGRWGLAPPAATNPTWAKTYRSRAHSGAPYRVLVTFTGHGKLTTRHFKVRANASWELRWSSYRCPAGRPTVMILVKDVRGSAGGRAAVAARIHASMSRGAHWLGPNGATYFLEVISTCSWTVHVVQAS
jgi:hypothetical protein